MDWRSCAPPGYRALEHDGARIVALAGYEDAARAIAGGGLPPVGAVGGGREPHPVLRLPSGERVVMRRYRRGGLVRHLLRARYLAGHRAFAELRAAERARAGGVRTPRVVAAVERPLRVGYTAHLATLLLDGSLDAATWLAEEADVRRRREMLRDAGRQLASMHGAGVAHPDVNLRNLLVEETAEGPRVAIIDFDRARLFPAPVPEARRRADLRRLARSARKLDARIGTDGWGVLREGYGAEWPPRLVLG